MTAPHRRVATIVMYHIVHGTKRGVLGRLKGLQVSAFRNQLDYIRRHYTPVGILDLAAACTDGHDLPRRPIVLSFDDGYLGHHDVVFPILADARIPAVFFPVAASMLDRAVLDVNKIQCVLAAADDVSRLVRTIETAVEKQQPRLQSCAEYRARYWKPSRWDPPEIVYIKRLLQHALPEELRRALIDDLFHSYVTADERTFADELYMSAHQARTMREAGMTVGAHGDRHLRLSTLAHDAQAAEIDGALRVLDAAGAPRHDFAYSYSNGDYNDLTLDLLRSRQCATAVTTAPALARMDPSDVLTLPRIDANDLPMEADAGPNVWTLRASDEIAT